MPTQPKILDKTMINATFDYFDNILANDPDYDFIRWVEQPIDFTHTEADGFFIGVMLDQGQLAERAWAGGKHLVDNHFIGDDCNFWHRIRACSDKKVLQICTTGFNGQHYALSFQANKFPVWLKSAAEKMIEEYKGDPRTIWDVKPGDVGDIYDRFIEFDGIGDALAKMAQFILVRNYGVAGGQQNQAMMCVKPDRLVLRVLYRAGIGDNKLTTTMKKAIELLDLRGRPADFDAAIWLIGRDYCKNTNPNCDECPIKNACMKRDVS